MPYALVVGAGLLLGGADHIPGISTSSPTPAGTGALACWRGAGDAVITLARRMLQNAAASRDLQKAAAALIAEAVNKWICEQAAPQCARRRKFVTLSC